MIYNSAVVNGSYHMSRGLECQDCVEFKKSGKEFSKNICVASDGATGSAIGASAASINCKAAIEYFSDSRKWSIESDEKLIDDLADHFSEKLDASNLDYEQLSATVASVAVNENEDFIIASVGDCTVVAFDNAMNPIMMCEPFVEYYGSTHFTNEYEETVRTMRIRRGNMRSNGITGFAIFTDGLSCITNEMLSGAEMLREMVLYAVADPSSSILSEKLKYIASNKTDDDAAIVIMFTDESCQIAKNIIAAEQERKRLIDIGRNNGSNAAVSFSSQPPKYDYILRALCDNPMTAEELVNNGICTSGRVLSTMKPLTEMKMVNFTGGRFVLSSNIRRI